MALAGSTAQAGGRGPELQPVGADAAAIDQLRAGSSAECDRQVRAELRDGQRLDDACANDRERAGKAVVRRRDVFGFVERRQVDLASLRLVLGLAKRCRQWPLRSPGRDVLRRNDAHEAGCRLRRFQGEVTLTFIDHEGRRSTPLPPVRTDLDGKLELRFATLDRALRALGVGSLHDFARIELGEQAWAGYVDLSQLLRFRADWHLAWVARGRGSPGLFAVQHPEHPGADEARTLAADAQLARQERDYQRVRRGRLPARSFLDRYRWSPYRRRVEALGRIADSVSASE
ncbi:MAG: hypothetical protein AAF799_42650 [Myxococcota bacterium]